MAKNKKCNSCLAIFKGRKDAKTCSAACRKALQRAREAMQHEVGAIVQGAENFKEEVKSEAVEFKQAVDAKIIEVEQIMVPQALVPVTVEAGEMSFEDFDNEEEVEEAPETEHSFFNNQFASAPGQVFGPQATREPAVTPAAVAAPIPVAASAPSTGSAPVPVVFGSGNAQFAGAGQFARQDKPARFKRFWLALLVLLFLMGGSLGVLKKQNDDQNRLNAIAIQKLADEQAKARAGDKEKFTTRDLLVTHDAVIGRNLNVADTTTTKKLVVTDGIIAGGPFTLNGNLVAGNITGRNITGGSFSGNGAGLTNVNASTLEGQNGAYYSNADNINSGTIRDERLSRNVALLNRDGQTFSGANTFTGAVTLQGGLRVSGPDPIVAIFGGRVAGGEAVNGNEFVTLGQLASSSASTYFLQDGNSFGATATIGTNDNQALQLETNGITRFTIDTNGNINAGGSITANGFAGNGSGLTGVDAALLQGNNAAFYQNAGNLNAGTVADARLAGSYSGVTGTGELTSGSIATGFGTIATANTIQGSQLISTASSGTAPLVVASTTKVANLNADFFDGYDSSDFAAANGSGNYIQNGNGLQGNANFNIQSASASVVGASIRGAASQTADLFQLQNSGGTPLFAVSATGNGSLAGNLTLGGSLQLQNSGFTQTALTSLGADYTGLGIGLGAGGATIISSGEGVSYVSPNISPAVETLYLTSDNDIRFYTNLQNGWAGRVSALNISTTGQLQLPVQGATGGLLIGGDTNLYRSAADTLRTDDALIVGGTIAGGSTIQGGQFISTVATGTAPLTVVSSTKVANLNADLLDGLDSTAFAPVSGSGNYIQNGTTPQTANFNITGNGTVGGNLAVSGTSTLTGNTTVGGTLTVSSGNVVVGTNGSNTGKIQLSNSGANTNKPYVSSSSTGDLKLHSFSTLGTTEIGSNGGIIFGNTTSADVFTEQARFTSAGNFGIGTNAPSSLLQLGSDAGTAASGIKFGSTGDTNLYRSAAGVLKTDNSLRVGTIGAGGTNLLCYDGNNQLATCSAAPGSGNYIFNGTALQTANFNIQSAAAGSVGGVIRGAASQTADLLQLQNSGGTTLLNVTAGGNLNLAATSSTGGQITQGGNRLIHTTGGTTNFFAGTSAGNLTLTGTSNTGVGSSALLSTTAGIQNIAVGTGALYSTTVGSSNTATGYVALYSNVNGSNNTAVGHAALYSNTGGSNNTAFGYNAGRTATSANANTTGTQNTFIGYQSGPGSATQLQNASSIGAYSVVSQDNSLVLGCINGVNSCTASTKIGIGTATPAYTFDVAGGTGVVGQFSGRVIGGNAVNSNEFTTKSQLDAVTTGTAGAFIQNGNNYGALAVLGTNDNFGLALETNNVERLRVDTSGNVGIGTTNPLARLDVDTGGIRVFGDIKTDSQTDFNTFLGVGSGNANTVTGVGPEGLYNTFQGYRAGYSNTTGSSNTANGTSALQNNTVGYNNTATGFNALYVNTTGYANTASGYAALYANTTGAGNVALGQNAGRINTTGSNNTFLGYQAGYTGSSDGLTNATAIGYNAQVTASNSLILGNGANVGIGTTAPSSALQLGSDAGTAASGIKFGSTGDTNLYRSAADTLKTDDTLIVSGGLNVAGDLNATSRIITPSIARQTSIGSTGSNPYDVLVLANDGGASKAIQTTTARDPRVYGISASTYAANSTGNVYISGSININVDTTAVAIGDQLVTSTTAGRATVDNNATTGIIGYAMTSKAGGSNGTVAVYIQPTNGQSTPRFQNTTNSTTAFQIQDATGTSNLFNADTTNTRIGIGTNAPNYTLDVAGDINLSGNLRINGVIVCSAAGCTGGGGGVAGSFINNQTTLQTAANFNIQSAGAGNVGGIIRGASGQTADLFQLQNSGAANVLAVGSTGATLFQNSANSTTAFRIQNATGTSNLFNADTTNTRIGIGTATPSDTLDVNGIIRVASLGASGSTAVCRNASNQLSGCSANPNGVTLQSAYDAGNTITTTDARNINFTLADTTTDSNFLVNVATGSTGKFAVQKNGVDTFSVDATGKALYKNTADSTTAFQIQNAAGTTVLNVDTTNQALTVRGSNSTAALGTDMLVNGNFATNDFTGWTAGPGWNASTGAAAHTPGNTAAISQTVTVTGGTTYQIDFSQTGATAGSLAFAIGSQSNLRQYYLGTSLTIVASGTGSQTFSITPSTDYDGTIDNITLKPVTGIAAAVLKVLNSDGTTGLEIRSGGSGLNNTAIGLSALQSNTTGSSNTANGLSALQSNTTGFSNTANGLSALQSNTTGYYNTANGLNALRSNTTGSSNTANGVNALLSNTTGSQNTAIGLNALLSNTTGYYNTANGLNALLSNTTGYYNTANGVYALYYNTTGFSNTANGVNALYYNTTGFSNTANGVNALYYNTTGFQNTANGLSALQANTTGYLNTANGVYALLSNTTGAGNVGLGYQAGYTSVPANANTTGFRNTFLGYNSGPGSTTQLQNATAIGTYSVVSQNDSLILGCLNGVNGCTADTKVGIGTSAPLQKLDVNNGNIRLGQIAAPGAPTVAVNATAGNLNGTYYYRVSYVTANGETETGAVSASVAPANQQVNLSAIPTSSDSSVTGRKIYRTTANGTTFTSQKLVTTINDNTTTTYTDNTTDGSLGANENRINTTGGIIYNGTTKALVVDNATTAVGLGALSVNKGNFNSALGLSALQVNTTGNQNTANGAYSLRANTTGSNNTALGSQALFSNTTGASNAATGTQTLFGNTTGNNNTASGIYALYANTTGSNNIGLGYQAGYTSVAVNANTTGSNNTFIGYNSGPGSTTQLQNSGAIGVNSVVSQNDSLVLGCTNGVNGCTASTKVGINTTAPGNLLSIGALTTASASAQIAVSTNGTTNSGIVVQTVAGQTTGNILQAQDSTGATLASIDYQGNLTVKAATINGNLTVNGHIITGNSSGTTTAAPGATAGTGATVTIDGNDTAGTITVVAGAGANAGDIAAIAFANAYATSPRIVISANNANAASLQYYRTASTTGFNINVRIAPVNGQTYVFDYLVQQ